MKKAKIAGWRGKILKVDLGSGSIREEELPQELMTNSGRPSANLPPAPPRLPNLVASTTPERLPFSALPSSVSLWPLP